VAANTNLKLLVAGVVLSILAGTPSLAPAKEEGQRDSKAFRVHLVKTLNLHPEKARIFIQVEEKYDRIRQEAIERIQKSEEQLDKLLSGEKPDEGKLKELTTAIASDQDILVNTYKGRRDETLAILTPFQQGKYLSATWKWQQKLLGQYGKPKTGQQDGKKKAKAP
jgi:Spy/CpxP family protein refolding chaperone